MSARNHENSKERRRKMVVKSSTKHIGGVPFQERTLPNSKHQAQGHFVAKDAIPLEASWSTLLWRPRSITATTWMAWGNSKQEMAFQMGRPLFLSFLASPVFKKKVISANSYRCSVTRKTGRSTCGNVMEDSAMSVARTTSTRKKDLLKLCRRCCAELCTLVTSGSGSWKTSSWFTDGRLTKKRNSWI